MAFSPETRTRALVAAARYCCVCHRYKGVKVEVHHIVPQADEGSDELDNAIALCFDCHADAGHYNPRQPRGTKFSRTELRQARDAWYAIVERHGIPGSTEPDWLYCRYLVCKDFGALLEISRGDFAQIPVPNMLLVENPVLEFLRSVLRAHGEVFRHARAWGERYRTEDEFFGAHPNAMRTSRSGVAFPYFETVRTPSLVELQETVAPSDSVTRMLLECGVPAEEIARVVGFFEPCGAGGFQEMYRLRPLWGVFLVVTNIAKEPVRLGSVTGLVEDSGSVGFRSLEVPGRRHDVDVRLPAAPVSSGSSVVVPVASVLAPLEHVSGEQGAQVEQCLEAGQWQSVAHVMYSQADLGGVRLVGPSIRPHGLWLEAGRERRFQEVHELDLSNLYTLARGWEVGSCPHLFFVGQGGRLTYVGELFSKSQGKPTVETVQIPNGTTEVVIAELERETTHIESIQLGCVVVSRDEVLQKGDVVRIRVGEAQTVSIAGWYEADVDVGDDVWVRNEVVAQFLSVDRRRLRRPSGARA